MTVYAITIFIIIFLDLLLRVLNVKKQKKIYVVSVGLWMFLILILRNETVGADISRYLRFYTEFGLTDWNWKEIKLVSEKTGDIEIGFIVFNKLLFCVFRSPRILIISISALFIGVLCKEVYERSDNPRLSFILYIGLGMFTRLLSALRQQMALSIVMISFRYIRKKKFFKFLMLILIAFTIHKSALCVIPMYFLSQKHVNKKIIRIFCVGYAFCYLIGGKLILFITTHYYPRYTEYYIGKNDGAVGALLIYSCLLVITVVYLKKDKYRSMYIYFNLLLILFAVLTFYLPIAARIFCYFDIMLIFAVPNAVSNIKAYSTRKVGEYVISLVVLLYYFMVICREDTSSVIPYTFMWG